MPEMENEPKDRTSPKVWENFSSEFVLPPLLVLPVSEFLFLRRQGAALLSSLPRQHWRAMAKMTVGWV